MFLLGIHTGPLRADGINDCLGNLDGEARAVFDAGSVLICTRVDLILDELIDEVTVCAVNLDAIKTCFYCVVGGLSKLCYCVLDVFLGHLFRYCVFCVKLRRAGTLDCDSISFSKLRVGHTSECPELQTATQISICFMFIQISMITN